MSTRVSPQIAGSERYLLPIAPLSFFAMTLGLAETGNAWRGATATFGAPAWPGEALQALAVLSFLWWTFLYANKWLNHGAAARAELTDPVQSSFLALFPESLILAALAIHPYLPGVAIATFWTGSALNILYAIYRLSRLWVLDRSGEHTTPSLFLVYVASVMVNALAAAHFGYVEFGWCLFGVGAISWLILDSVISGRLFVGGLETRMRNFMGIYMAPSAVAFVAFQMLSGDAGNLPITYGLFGYAMFIAVTLLFAWSWLTQQAFAPGYWAYTFGISTLSQGSTLLYARQPNAVLFGISVALLVASTIVLVIVAALSVGLLKNGNYYSPRP